MQSQLGTLKIRPPIAVRLQEVSADAGYGRQSPSLGFQVFRLVRLNKAIEVLDPLTNPYPTGLDLDTPLEWREAALCHLVDCLEKPYALGMDLHPLCLQLTRLDADWFSAL